MEEPTEARRLLGVFAHPDDEVFCAGGTMLGAADRGSHVVVLSVTRGERGPIRDAAAATRRTLGAVRERELRAAGAALGVRTVRVLGFGDGTLPRHGDALTAAVEEVMDEVDPDAVVTFAEDGGYGHPDHVTISAATTAAFRAHAGGRPRGQRLFHAVFPPRPTSMAEELARWLVDSGRPAAAPAALSAIALFAGESSTMRLARDDVRIEWFPPGVSVVEQGEAADALYLILNGVADALRERPDGELVHLRRMGAGQFFGELGLVAGDVRTAHVVAAESLTCLVLSRAPVTAYAGRGAGAAAGGPTAALPVRPGMIEVDVRPYLDRKLEALARHRTQYPIVPSMLPRRLLTQMLGTEFFRCAAEAPSRLH